MANNTCTDYEETLRPEEIEDDEDQDDDDEDDEELQDWDDWNAEDREGEEEEDGFDSDFLCLFCDSRFTAIDSLFDHCTSTHYFDFRFIREALRLDFYGSLKLINYVRSRVAENKCWSCGVCCVSNQELLNHLHEVSSLDDIKPLWDSDAFLKPFLQDDSLLFSFGEDDEADGDYAIVSEVDKDELMNNFKRFEEMSVDSDVASASNDHLNLESSSGKIHTDGLISRELVGPSERKTNDKHLRTYFPNCVARDVKIVNEDYFGSYSSFGIHREMLSDKVRMDAYSQAILKNPSLFNGAVVMDVGCGTGILSLFAAQAGASRVIAIEASEKMAAVATQIAKDNDFLRGTCSTSDSDHCNGVVEVVRTMVEELDEKINIQPNSIDVLLSEWMGYCLLYESMLSSVLYARDRWLKPGGAILPDTATIIAAGFGKGGTSLPFWEDVYGFKMSCVGKELVEGAAQIPIVDVVDGHDLVTKAAVLKTFDLVTMRPDDVDFTATVELEPSLSNSANLESKTTRCYGAILWFETGFTSRFCKQTPANLSTSPHTPSTHWSQTILTFREPIVMASQKLMFDKSAAIGSNACPAMRINLRMSIVRASQHRSIDISMETVGIGPDGRKRSWPVQLFNMR